MAPIEAEIVNTLKPAIFRKPFTYLWTSRRATLGQACGNMIPHVRREIATIYCTAMAAPLTSCD